MKNAAKSNSPPQQRKINLYWPAFLIYVVITGVDRFITDIPNKIYIPLLLLCLAGFIFAFAAEIITAWRNRRANIDTSKNTKTIIASAAIIIIAAACLSYTRPQAIEQRYPYLDLAQCTEFNGYFFTDFGKEDTPFSITSADADFYKLADMVQGTKFKAKLASLLPQGAKTHNYSAGDYSWNLFLCFDEINLPDGSILSGTVLHFYNFFGELSYSFNGHTIQCRVEDQSAWSQAIMDIITRYAAE